MPRTGFIDHIGIGVPDLVAAKAYYDELMPILGLKQWFNASPGGPFNYGPDGARGPQVFFYQARSGGRASRRRTGLHHLSFMVQSRAVVREAYEWAGAHGAVVLRRPRIFPEYGPDFYATYWLDPHGIMLEAVTYAPEEPAST
ncbi:MAG TPA: VOC family protein [Dehalococcoidia bacterium]